MRAGGNKLPDVNRRNYGVGGKKAALRQLVILHNDVGLNPAPDDADTLRQAECVYAAAHGAFDARIVSFKKLSDLSALPNDCVVFNLAEEYGGDGYGAYKIPETLEKLKIPFTGAGSAAMKKTGDKTAAKSMRAHGIPMPAYVALKQKPVGFLPGEYIIKPARQSGSKGIGENSVVRVDSIKDLKAILRKTDPAYMYFAERYIDGREIGVSMIEKEDGGAQILPPREICFRNFGNNYKILDYAAKWDGQSERYKNTVSVEMREESDAPLLRKLENICRAVWRWFGLRGWARVDFRIDRCGTPFVLEINCNPCLTPPDSGFYLAAESAGLTLKDVIGRLIEYARF